MIVIDKAIIRQYRTGDMSTKSLADYLLRTYPVTEIALALAETMTYDPPKPITLTQEEFNEHFRIRGVRPDGEIERRGRKKESVIPGF